MTALTVEKILSEFAYVEELFGESEVYHDSICFEGHGNLCDVYFVAREKHVNQEQAESYNMFIDSFKGHLSEIERFILSTLRSSEIKQKDWISKSVLYLDVIEIPYESTKYDMVLVCGKQYRKFVFFKRHINLRVEFKDGRIKSIQRKNAVTEENE